MRIPPEHCVPEKPSNDRADIEVYAGYIEAAHERQVQIIFLMLIMPLYFITTWIAMVILPEGSYENTFGSLTAIVIGVFLFAFQTKIRAVLAKLLLH